jgi:preprotein translocase subunit SecG
MILIALAWQHYAFMIPLAILSVFLTLVILVQRGRGGGLTGALGGMGGASAFGTKAGDLFTKITIAVAFVWIILSMASLKFLNVSPFDTTASGTAGQPKAVDKAGKDGSKDTESKSGSATTPPADGIGAGASGTTEKGSATTPPPAGGSPDSGEESAKPATTTP